MTHTTTRVQDNDGHWYWIPNEKFLKFNKDLEAITGIEYMDNPDAFDKFNEDYGVYATGGAPDLMPDIFKQKDTSNPDDMVVNPITEVPDYISELSDLYEAQKDLIHSCIGIPAELQGQMLDGVKKMRDMCAKAFSK